MARKTRSTVGGLSERLRFNGKTYTLHTTLVRKSDAQTEARFLRGRGLLVRVVSIPKSQQGKTGPLRAGGIEVARYAVYTRRDQLVR